MTTKRNFSNLKLELNKWLKGSDKRLTNVTHGKALQGVNFINILRAHFSPIFWCKKISNPKHSFLIFGAKILAKKARVKC